MAKLYIFCAIILAFYAGCAKYSGEEEYSSYKNYLNRYAPEYSDSTFSSKRDSGIPPSESINLGDSRDSEAIQRATMKAYQINGKWYYPQKVQLGESWDGIASWYGPDFHNKKTSNGEIYNMNLHTAAHKTLPMNTILKVYSLDSGKSTIVRINDRGPFVEGRIIDLSKAAAEDIAMTQKGTARVNIEVIGFSGVVSDSSAGSSTIIHDMVTSSDLNREFTTGATESIVIGGEFSVQVGAFRNKDGAESTKNARNFSGYSTHIKQGEDGIYRVFVSGFKSEEEARDFIKEKNIEGFLVRD